MEHCAACHGALSDVDLVVRAVPKPSDRGQAAKPAAKPIYFHQVSSCWPHGGGTYVELERGTLMALKRAYG
jgi:hypothetical protein